MRIDVHIHEESYNEVLDKLDQVLFLVHKMNAREKRMSAELDRVEATLIPMANAEDAAIALLNQLSDMIRAAATDPARLTAIADEIETKAAALASAVVANTPAAP